MPLFNKQRNWLQIQLTKPEKHVKTCSLVEENRVSEDVLIYTTMSSRAELALASGPDLVYDVEELQEVRCKSACLCVGCLVTAMAEAVSKR